jgi:hypothetical protein
MRTTKAKAKLKPGFIPISRCQYKLVDHKQLGDDTEAAPKLDEPASIDPAIKAPKDQLEEEEELEAAREAAKAAVHRLITVLRAVAEVKARSASQSHYQINKYLLMEDLNDGRIAIRYLYPPDALGFYSPAHRYGNILKHELQGRYDRKIQAWTYESAREAEIKEVLARLIPLGDAEIEREKQKHQRLTEEAEAAYAKAYSGYDEDENEDEEAPLFIEDLDDYRIIVGGNTYPYRDRLKELGGSWHKVAKGWVYPKRLEGELRGELSDLLLKDTNLVLAERTKNRLCAYPGCSLPGSMTRSTMHETSGEANWFCRYHFKISLQALPSPSAAP